MLSIFMLCPGDCSCTDFVKDGYGKCQKVHPSNKQFFCYVNQLSNCPDLKDSKYGGGKQYSFLACHGYQGKRVNQKNTYSIIVHVILL